MLYIHIPFCRQACSYCDFHFSTSAKYQEEMWTAIQKEIFLSQDFLNNKKIETIYFGGGTPSLMPITSLQQIIESIEKVYDLNELKEVTLEANPDDLSKEYLTQLKGTFINRLSIGIQSFQDEDLKLMNRAHNAQEADYCIKLAQDIGFENLSCDLIFGTPTLSDNDLQNNILQLAQNDVAHIAAYSMTIEEKTALDNWVKKGIVKPKDNESYARQMLLTMDLMEKMGYEQYEISNYAKDGKYAIHNSNYWKGKPYLGIGPSAHSYKENMRRWNVRNNALYLKSILQQNTIPFEEEILTEENQINEKIMTQLRTKWGLDLEEMELNFGSDIADQILSSAHLFLENGMLISKDKKLFLSKHGKLIADNIASDLFVG